MVCPSSWWGWGDAATKTRVSSQSCHHRMFGMIIDGQSYTESMVLGSGESISTGCLPIFEDQFNIFLKTF